MNLHGTENESQNERNEVCDAIAKHMYYVVFEISEDTQSAH